MPHEGLDGKTPAETCGIQVNGYNKWMTLMLKRRQNKFYPRIALIPAPTPFIKT
jgi:hypothetical protein